MQNEKYEYKKTYQYEEHLKLDVAGFEIVDAANANATESHELIWVGKGIHGSWLTFEEAIELAAGIRQAATNHAMRTEKRLTAQKLTK